MLRVGFDVGLSAVRLRTGIGEYCANLVPALGGLGDSEQLVLQQVAMPRLLYRAASYRPQIGRGLYLFWLNVALLRRARAMGVDLMHFMNVVGPITSDVKCPHVVSVFDVHSVTMPELGPAYGWYRRVILKLTMRSAAAIITCSEYSRSQIMQAFGVEQERVVSIPLAPDRSVFGEAGRQQPVKAAEACGSGGSGKFILSVGPLKARKNHSSLMRAFAQLKRQGLEHRLVVCGARDWQFRNLQALASQLGVEDQVEFVGHVGKMRLSYLYSICEVFVYPSLYEGFGLPCLEAMACGAPVIASNRTALPETVGTGGLCVDPTPSPLAEAIGRLVHDTSLRRAVAEAGAEWVKQFSWRRTAEETASFYRRVVGS